MTPVTSVSENRSPAQRRSPSPRPSNRTGEQRRPESSNSSSGNGGRQGRQENAGNQVNRPRASYRDTTYNSSSSSQRPQNRPRSYSPGPGSSSSRPGTPDSGSSRWSDRPPCKNGSSRPGYRLNAWSNGPPRPQNQWVNRNYQSGPRQPYPYQYQGRPPQPQQRPIR